MSRTIALIAHAGRREELVELAHELVDDLADCRLIAGDAVAGLLRDRLGLDVDPVVATPIGGDGQIAALVAAGEVDLVIFLGDAFRTPFKNPEPKLLERICSVRGVPLATTRAAAISSIGALGRMPGRAAQDALAPAAWLA